MARGPVDLQVCSIVARDVPASRSPHSRPAVRAPAEAGPGKRRRGEEEAEEEEEGEERHVYQLDFHGKTADGRTLCVEAGGYTPMFYLQVEGADRLADSCEEALRKHVAGILGRRLARELRRVLVRDRGNFFGFDHDRRRDFAMVTFDSERAMRCASRRIMRPSRGRNEDHVFLGGQRRRLRVFEADVEPVSRLLHAREIKSGGWLRVDAGGPWGVTVAGGDQGADAVYRADYRALGPAPGTRAMGPIRVTSFDIECLSRCHSLFPAAVRRYDCVASFADDCLREAREVLGGLSREEIRGALEAAVMACFGLRPPAGTLAAGLDERMRSHRLLADTATKCEVTPKGPVTAEELYARLTSNGLSEDIRAFLTENVVYQEGEEGDSGVSRAAKVMDAQMPALEGDMVVQVGMCTQLLGVPGASVERYICVLGGCDAIEGVEVESCPDEASMLLALRDKLRAVNPELVVGYNSNGFDSAYLQARAAETGVATEFARWSRARDRPVTLKVVRQAATGDGAVWVCHGRTMVDLLQYVNRNFKLQSKTLDSVSKKFLGEEEGKHDLKAKDIFRLQLGSDADRARVAAYCIQDCDLVLRLFVKLRVLPNSAAKASLQFIPLSYCFERGMLAGCESLMSYYMQKRGVIRETRDRDVQKKRFEDKKVEGARVVPGTGFYRAAAVFDFGSLYPSCIRARNLCSNALCAEDPRPGLDHERYACEEVLVPRYEGKGAKKRLVETRRLWFVTERGKQSITAEVVSILIEKRNEIRARMQHVRLGELVGAAREETDPDTGETWVTIGGARAGLKGEARPEPEPAYTPEELSVMEAEQLSTKVACNSIYGMTAACTSGFYDADVAEAITATAREMLGRLIAFVEAKARQRPELEMRVVYGDTDSGFVVWKATGDDGRELRGDAAALKMRELALVIEAEFNATLPFPQKVVFEKVFVNFSLFKKKRYSGMYYEAGLPPGKVRHQGTQMARMDSAGITRKCMGDLLQSMLEDDDLEAGLRKVMQMLEDVAAGRAPLELFVKSKRLKIGGHYKVPPAHKVLAMRAARRGNEAAIAPGDYVHYVHVVPEGGADPGKMLMQDRIETLEHVQQHGCAVDYEHYVRKDMMAPIEQVLAVVVESLPGAKGAAHWASIERNLRLAFQDPTLHAENVESEIIHRITELRKREVRRVLFDPILARIQNDAQKKRNADNGQSSVLDYWKPAAGPQKKRATAAPAAPDPGAAGKQSTLSRFFKGQAAGS